MKEYPKIDTLRRRLTVLTSADALELLSSIEKE